MREDEVNLPTEKRGHRVKQIEVLGETQRGVPGQQQAYVPRWSEVVPHEGAEYGHFANAESPAHGLVASRRHTRIGETAGQGFGRKVLRVHGLAIPPPTAPRLPGERRVHAKLRDHFRNCPELDVGVRPDVP